MQWKLTFKQLFTNTAVHLTLSTASTSNHNHNFIVSIYSVSDLMHCTWPSDLTIHYLHVTYPHVKSFSFSYWKGCPLHCIHWLLNFISYLLTFKDKGHCCTSLPLDQEKSDLTSGGILAAFNKIGWTANNYPKGRGKYIESSSISQQSLKQSLIQHTCCWYMQGCALRKIEGCLVLWTCQI